MWHIPAVINSRLDVDAAAVSRELRSRFDSVFASAVTIIHFAGHSFSHRTTSARARPWRPAQQQQPHAWLWHVPHAHLSEPRPQPLTPAPLTNSMPHTLARVTQPGWPSVSLPPTCIFGSSHATLNPWADRRASRCSGSWQRLGSYASCSSCTGWTRAVSGSIRTARGGGDV